MSNYKRGFNKITYDIYNKSYFILFRNKNDIPNFNYEKSIIYIDNGHNILFKIDLRNYNNRGYAFSFVSIEEFYEEYKDILTKCPEREIWKYYDKYLELKDKEKNIIIKANIYDFYNTERQNILKLDRIIQKYYYDILNKEKLEKNKERLL